ncbi:sperm flagellar protein 1 isoform X2 [Notamacropus eugenii]|uniref:sperm flagellar protein 1 isoform X2 n=1 Tax=Notamacropus eugenii TaxID=9315 RepID=UPI003B672008
MVLAAEVVKFYFPKMVEMHNYVPANSVQQKINNWIHLNRKVLHKLNFSIPEDVIQKIAQCSPGVVELVLIPLRQRLEEKKQRKQGVGSSQELGLREGSNYMDMGFSQKTQGGGTTDPQKAGPLRGGKFPPAYSQALQGDPNFLVQMAEKEQELLASQETVQVLQMKVRRLEHLLQLKNVRIDDLSRRLQQAQRKPRKKRQPLEPEPRNRTTCLLPEALGTGDTECSMGHSSTLHMLWENMALALISSCAPCNLCNWAAIAKALSHLILSQRSMCQASSPSLLAPSHPHHHNKGELVPSADLFYSLLAAKSTRAGQGFLWPGRQG